MPGRREHAQRDLVRHAPRRREQRGLLAEQRGRERFEPLERRVLAVRVVADLGRGHRRAHLGCRLRDRVGPQVDDRAHGEPAPSPEGPTGRISPSCITVMASFPSLEHVHRARARARSTPTGSSGGTAATRRHGTDGGTTSRGRGSPSGSCRRTRSRAGASRCRGGDRSDAYATTHACSSVVIGQAPVGADPHVLHRLARSGREPLRILDRTRVDRSLAPEPVDEVLTEPIEVRLDALAERREVVGTGDVGHRASRGRDPPRRSGTTQRG